MPLLPHSDPLLAMATQEKCPRQQICSSVRGRFDRATERSLLRIPFLSEDSETEDFQLMSSYSEREDHEYTGDEASRRSEKGSKILQKLHVCVASHPELLLVREKVGKLKKEARKQRRDRPRRTSHAIELVV